MNLRRGDKIVVNFCGQALVATVRKTGQEIWCMVDVPVWSAGNNYDTVSYRYSHFHVRKRDEGRTWARENTVEERALRASLILAS